jgi:hypothetical protein
MPFASGTGCGEDSDDADGAMLMLLFWPRAPRSAFGWNGVKTQRLLLLIHRGNEGCSRFWREQGQRMKAAHAKPLDVGANFMVLKLCCLNL